ncbi:hypothetical protein C7K38_03855 [Tetragenococcus osmophilus]|uniref:Uncharacterized protein n=1 Tax=Tetragenococcus osmophilus TaxID=526944 RepID=A0AA37XL65_9ENTE|nr:hypothetical protein [Tetragenococcus osmophilus]AYW47586.1 hypothetical protein C7K38_03855 [Tetragenococcus osmophilus]GMA53211.1 hypothetical protein GCM10025857_45680 [Alicyclobacillus contaminans]GMA72817.1 hypothetical protein GCM10025885_18660 [Tetragenococcus osmophilus]
MSAKHKKLLFFIGAALVLFLLIYFGWKLLAAILAQGTIENYTRSALPYGFVFVLFFPIVATSTLFLGLAHSKK